jgi:hypothetical protein
MIHNDIPDPTNPLLIADSYISSLPSNLYDILDDCSFDSAKSIWRGYNPFGHTKQEVFDIHIRLIRLTEQTRWRLYSN